MNPFVGFCLFSIVCLVAWSLDESEAGVRINIRKAMTFLSKGGQVQLSL